jgi:hypothetical protein
MTSILLYMFRVDWPAKSRSLAIRQIFRVDGMRPLTSAQTARLPNELFTLRVKLSSRGFGRKHSRTEREGYVAGAPDAICVDFCVTKNVEDSGFPALFVPALLQNQRVQQ